MSQDNDDSIPPLPPSPDEDTGPTELSIDDLSLGGSHRSCAKRTPETRSSDQLVDLAGEAAQERISQRYFAAIKESEIALNTDKSLADEPVYFSGGCGKPSRADRERIGGRYLARVAAAESRHAERVNVARATSAETSRLLRSILYRVKCADNNKQAILKFSVELLNAL